VSEQDPFADVRLEAEGFSIPELKWRELLFVGALRPDGEHYRRDPLRPLPPFQTPDLFPEGALFRVSPKAGRVRIERL
jgi:hypothetical protein